VEEGNWLDGAHTSPRSSLVRGNKSTINDERALAMARSIVTFAELRRLDGACSIELTRRS
jgi:hypothetical protein